MKSISTDAHARERRENVTRLRALLAEANPAHVQLTSSQRTLFLAVMDRYQTELADLRRLVLGGEPC